MSSIQSYIPSSCKLGEFTVIGTDVVIGENVRISNFCNIYECELGKDVVIGSFVELQRGCRIGDRTHISSHTFVCSLVEIGIDCFVGHSVNFTNDTFEGGRVHYDSDDWKKTVVESNVIIGSNSTILPVRLGHHCVIGAGAVVTKDVPPYTIVVGNPARKLNTKLWK